MTDDPLVFKLISGGILAVGLLFVALFIREPWRKNLYGWAVMEFSVGLVLFALAATLKNKFGTDYPLRSTVRIIANGLVLIAFVQQTWVLWRTQHARRNT